MARPRTVRTANPRNLELLWESQDLSLRALEAFLAKIESEELQGMVREDDALFAWVVKLAVEEYGVAQVKLSERLALSLAAIGRWVRSENLPPPYVRQSVLIAIAGLILPHVERERQKRQHAKKSHQAVLRGRLHD